MAQLEPPPTIIKEFTYLWKEWISKLYTFIKSHTGGSTPVSPATGTSWNAHGNTATGSATSPLKIDSGAFFVEGNVGDSPLSGATSGFTYIPSKYALRAGQTTGTQWDSIGDYSYAFGNDCTAPGANTIAFGGGAAAGGVNNIALGTSSAASNNSAIAIGNTAVASAQNSICIGVNTTASGNNNVAIGAIASAGGGGSAYADAVVIGNTSFAGNTNTFAIGKFVSASASGSIVIGRGVSFPFGMLSNTVPNSLMLGVGTTTPTFTLVSGRCGVGSTATSPLSTLDVRGSVGYQYRIITSAQSPPASPLTLSDELTVIADNSLGPVSLYLPSTSSIDRRIYHIKRAVSGGGTVKIYAATGEYIDGVIADLANGGATISAQDAPMLLCDNTSTNNGWWIL